MTFEIIVEPDAERDLGDASKYFSESARDLEFLDSLDALFARLATMPLRRRRTPRTRNGERAPDEPRRRSPGLARVHPRGPGSAA
jgi:plasmid stabilization system protein ParE